MNAGPYANDDAGKAGYFENKSATPTFVDKETEWDGNENV
jgi:hypothetical protein